MNNDPSIDPRIDPSITPKPEQPTEFDQAVDQAFEVVRPTETQPPEASEVAPVPDAEVEAAPVLRTELSTFKRVAIVAGSTVLAGLAVIGFNAGKSAVGDIGREASEQVDKERVALVTEYRETGQVPEGKVVIEPKQDGTAYDLAQEIRSENGDVKDLISDIHTQANAQGRPGVEAGMGEVYVVDKDDITPEAAEELKPQPEIQTPDGHTEVIQ